MGTEGAQRDFVDIAYDDLHGWSDPSITTTADSWRNLLAYEILRDHEWMTRMIEGKPTATIIPRVHP
jgi:hypothetical protein